MTSRNYPLLPILRIAFLAVPFAVGFAGCALVRPSPLSSVRKQISAGQYASAHQQLLALEAHPEQLTAQEMREVKDDLCLSEHAIGAPSYALGEQRRVCAEAAREPGSRSTQVLARIDESIRKNAAASVDAALAKGDLADAEQAALTYIDTPGADPDVISKWSRRMWQIVQEQDERAQPARKHKIAPAIAEVEKNNRSIKPMHKRAFREWIEQQGSNGSAKIFSLGSLKDHELELKVPKGEVQNAALNLDRFATINDALVARCGCDGRTDVAIAETNFPLYVVRLDPETRRSEVLILPHQ